MLARLVNNLIPFFHPFGSHVNRYWSCIVVNHGDPAFVTTRVFGLWKAREEGGIGITLFPPEMCMKSSSQHLLSRIIMDGSATLGFRAIFPWIHFMHFTMGDVPYCQHSSICSASFYLC